MLLLGDFQEWGVFHGGNLKILRVPDRDLEDMVILDVADDIILSPLPLKKMP